MGCKIIKFGHVTMTTPLQERLVVQRLTLDIAYNHTKFDDSIASAVLEKFQGGVKLKF